MHGRLPVAIRVLPHFILAAVVVLEFGTVLAATIGEVVAGARAIGAAVDGLAVAGAGRPDLGAGDDAFLWGSRD